MGDFTTFLKYSFLRIREQVICNCSGEEKSYGGTVPLICCFQVVDALEFLAELTQYILDKGQHLIHYFGWYSSKEHGMRKKRAVCGKRRYRGRLIRNVKLQKASRFMFTAVLSVSASRVLP